MLTKLKRLGLWDVSLNMEDNVLALTLVTGAPKLGSFSFSPLLVAAVAVAVVVVPVASASSLGTGPPKTSPSLARSEKGTISIVDGSIANISSDAAFDFASVSC